MSNTPAAPRSNPLRFPPALAGAALLVIGLGFGLPMLAGGGLPDPAPPEAAAKPAAPAPIRPPEATGIGWSLVKLAAGLAVVCGACVLGAKLFGQKPPEAGGAMEVVASIAVAQTVLHLVRAGDRRLLVGTDPAGVKAVLELPRAAPEPAPEPPAPAEAAAAPAAPLTQEEVLSLLLRLRARNGAPPPA